MESIPIATAAPDLDVNAPPAASAEPQATPAVQLTGLTHRYPKASRDAVSDLSLSIQPGEAFALLGPNGGGKTTTFRILATLLQPSATQPGAVQLFGQDVLANPAAARRMLGVVFQSPSLDIKLTARENLDCQARLHGLPRLESTPRIDEALARFDLTPRMHDAVETFSGGMKRKLEIAKALLHRPRLLLMDEPATGLDPAARRELWDHLADLRQRHDLTIAWTTHLMDEAEHADRLAVLASGQVLTVSTPGELKASLGSHVISVEPLHPDQLGTIRDQIDAAFGPWAPGKEPAVIQDTIRFEHEDGPAIVARIAEQLPGGVRRISVGQPTLEDAYLRLTQTPSS
ncbi:ABC transporter ATP-binding protein [Algisphaera agarilytica]|uniref:ABC-2 type transport system ATP-binding protein n=1 Tax=Algisphaera agarilytica TaxID=1385975 RepID=A0A7X0H7U4_9BACT|nr:ABC transporter ATP-binding protein [Algisphaera agarilytica]MBB6430868.1 ABC-2 type transport system ATP-binding protein [Algisphaera agarilytica]